LLLRFASSCDRYVYDLKSYPWSPAPTPSCIADVSLWESVFQFSVLYTCIFLFVTVCLCLYTYNRIYQHRDCSIHSHPELPHKNGKLYNDKSGGIVRSKKAYFVRDIHWTDKYRRSNRLSSEAGQTAPKEIGQHASNLLETKHSVCKSVFPQHQIYPVHWEYIPVAQIKIIFAMNIRNTSGLLKKFVKKEDNFDEVHVRLMGDIDDIHLSYLDLSKLKHKIDEFGHAYCWWNKIDRTLQTWFRGIEYKSCIKKVSRLLSSDYTMLFYVVYHEMVNDDFELHKLLKNESKLSIIQSKLSYRMSIEEIKSILWKEWTAKAGVQLDELFPMDNDENSVAYGGEFEIPKNAKKARNERYVSQSMFMYLDVCLCFDLFLIYIQK